MSEKQAAKAPKVPSKSFMTVGPTLHYSHKNVQRCWFLAVVAFGASCLFWSRIQTGSLWSYELEAVSGIEFWRLEDAVAGGVSIFEYPWQILVLGLLMGLMAMVPVLISQLMSFSYCVLFVLEVAFLARLPGFAVCVLISCFAAACRPLRFRSRFTAIALCTAPQLVYWGCFGGVSGVEPLKWGFSFAPWICAWLIGLGLAGLVLGIGHFTRYRPGLVWTFTSVFFVLAVVTFQTRIGFDELDYQLYVAKNNPESFSEFHDHSITEALDETITNPTIRTYLAGFFYPTEPIPLRAELKREIQIQLSYDRWPSWFMTTEVLDYQLKRTELEEQYRKFVRPSKRFWMPTFIHERLMERRAGSKRMPIALYYEGLLSEYRPDVRLIGEEELLHFCRDYPHQEARWIWHRLSDEFGDAPESIEARWRIAKHLAGHDKLERSEEPLDRFERADELLAEAQAMVIRQLELHNESKPNNGSSRAIFRPPADSVVTKVKLEQLQSRLNRLRSLIGPQNRTEAIESVERLATFVMLNPHVSDYGRRLDELLGRLDERDPLRDNVMLAKTKLTADEQLRAEKLVQLHRRFQDTDGGMEALYELGLLKIGRYQNETDSEQKKKYLVDARATLTSLVSLYPRSFYAGQVQKNLDDLPMVE